MGLDSSFCCLRVETGAIIIGAFGFVSSLFQVISSTVLLLVSMVASQLLEDICRAQVRSDGCSSTWLLACSAFVVFVYTLFKTIAYGQLVKGVEDAKESKFRLALVLYGIKIVLDVITLVVVTIAAFQLPSLFISVVVCVVDLAIGVYLYLVITSARDHIANSTNLPVYYKRN